MDNEIEYMRIHPPRCLGPNATDPSNSLKSTLKDQLGEDSTAFSPQCACGNSVFSILAPIEYFGGTKIACDECDKEKIIFDPTKHGYDGELGHYEGEEPGESKEHLCSSCGKQTFKIAIGFQYSGETDILNEENAPDVKPEDLFGWAMIATKCMYCGNIDEVVEVECA